MTHQQAYHTSCRSGLSGSSGFQINAATPSLDREQLAALSKTHARYETPSDLPYEPTPDEMLAFPVALKMSMVPGVGPVVSRTAYVGREYRGHNGAPDEGRFGNYFCHMVLGAPGDDPFDGLNAIELWDAPHWTTTESPDTSLPDLGALVPGPLDIAETLAAVEASPAGVAAEILDSALAAVAGGPPVLIVDSQVDRAAMWLAWLNYALPPRLAQELTFSTFEGRPQDVLDLHVIVTTPACDPGPAMSSRFKRIDADAPSTAAHSLYARAATELSKRGPEALAGAVRRVNGSDPAEQGAEIALAGSTPELVSSADLLAVLQQVRARLSARCVSEAADFVSRLPEFPEADAAAIAAWLDLHQQARLADDTEEARDLATTTLQRLIAHLQALPDELPDIPSDAPGAPRVGALGAWLRATEAAKGTDESARLIAIGLRLGLLGVNVPVDARAVAVITHELERPAMQSALERADAALIGATVDAVLAETGGTVRSRLLLLSRYDGGADAVRKHAEEQQTFEAQALWQHTRVVLDPASRSEAARVLAQMSAGPEQEQEVRTLWGGLGPATDSEMLELIHAYQNAGRSVPVQDIDRGLRLLMAKPLLTDSPQSNDLGNALSYLPGNHVERPEYHAWWCSVTRPDSFGETSLEKWAANSIVALKADASAVPDERWNELMDRVARTLIKARSSESFARVLREFERVDFPRLCEAMGGVMSEMLANTRERPKMAAQMFDFWIRVRIEGLTDLVLPTAFESLSSRDLADVSEFITDERLLPHWSDWLERNPRKSGIAKMLRRRGKPVQ